MTEFVKINGKFILKKLFSGYVTVLGQLHKSNHIDCDSTHPPFLMSAIQFQELPPFMLTCPSFILSYWC